MRFFFSRRKKIGPCRHTDGMTHSDVKRLTRIVTERAAALVLYARQWLDDSGADDAVQEALIALLAQRQPPRNPTAWMYRAVRNAAIDAGRAAERRRRREQSVARGRREWFISEPDAMIDSETAEQALQRLTPEHREVVVLRIWGDLAFGEIAELLELGVSTVHDRYKAALGQLKCVLEQPCPTNSN
jgi:RNA polymerase sigma-70 factor (ECF subfamily)